MFFVNPQSFDSFGTAIQDQNSVIAGCGPEMRHLPLRKIGSVVISLNIWGNLNRKLRKKYYSPIVMGAHATIKTLRKMPTDHASSPRLLLVVSCAESAEKAREQPCQSG